MRIDQSHCFFRAPDSQVLEWFIAVLVSRCVALGQFGHGKKTKIGFNTLVHCCIHPLFTFLTYCDTRKAKGLIVAHSSLAAIGLAKGSADSPAEEAQLKVLYAYNPLSL